MHGAVGFDRLPDGNIAGGQQDLPFRLLRGIRPNRKTSDPLRDNRQVVVGGHAAQMLCSILLGPPPQHGRRQPTDVTHSPAQGRSVPEDAPHKQTRPPLHAHQDGAHSIDMVAVKFSDVLGPHTLHSGPHYAVATLPLLQRVVQFNNLATRQLCRPPSGRKTPRAEKPAVSGCWQARTERGFGNSHTADHRRRTVVDTVHIGETSLLPYMHTRAHESCPISFRLYAPSVVRSTHPEDMLARLRLEGVRLVPACTS